MADAAPARVEAERMIECGLKLAFRVDQKFADVNICSPPSILQHDEIVTDTLANSTSRGRDIHRCASQTQFGECQIAERP